MDHSSTQANLYQTVMNMKKTGLPVFRAMHRATISCLMIFVLMLAGQKIFAQSATDYFRSVTTGNWNAPATWESSPVADFSSGVVSPTLIPDNNANTITIRSGHTVTVTASVTIDQTVVTAGGTLVQSANLTVADGAGTDLDVNGTLNLSGGALDGAGLVSVNSGGGVFNWGTAVMQGTGTTTIQSGATGSLTGTQNLTGPRIFNNGGSLSKSGGDIQLTANPFFTNSGTLDLTSDVGIISVAASGAIVNNTGTITKSAGGGNSNLSNNTDITFTNSGTGIVNANSGTISINTNATQTGTFNIGPGTLQFQGGTQTLSSASKLLGTGNLIFAGGTITVSTTAANYDATVVTTQNGAIVNWDNSPTINSFTLSSGTMQGSGTVSVATVFNWATAVMQGTGTTTIQSGATGSLTGTQNLTGPRIFNNAGSLSKSGGDIQLTANPFFTNSGTLDLTSDVGIISVAASGAIVNNTGTITKSAGGGNSNLSNSTDITFTNSGTGIVNANSGTISITTNATQTGTFNIGPGTLQFQGGTQTLSAASKLLGTGNLIFAGGTITVSTTAANYDATVVTTQNGAIVNWDNSPTINSFTLSSGTMQGSGTVSVATVFNWATAVMQGTGTTTIQSGATGSLTGTQNLTGPRIFNNAGSLSKSGGDIQLTANPFFTNSGTLDLTSDVGIISVAASGAIVNNTGTITKSAGGGNSNLSNNTDITFTNSGTGIVNANSGTISINTNATQTGTFNIGPGTLQFQGGTQTLSAASKLLGTGNLIFAGGTITVSTTAANYDATVVTTQNGAIVNWDNSPTINSFTLSSGTMQGSGTVSVATVFNWATAVMQGTGTTTIQSGATGSLTGTQNLTGPRIFNNAGSLSKSGGDIQLTANPFFTNSGTLDLTSDVGIISVAASGAIVNNTGTITKSAGGGNSNLSNNTDITFTNSGTGIVNANSGTISINTNATQTGTFNIGPGTLQFQGGTQTLSSASKLLGTGNLIFAGGTITVSTTAANYDATVVTTQNGAIVNWDNSPTINSFTLSSGTMQGSGTVSVATVFNWATAVMQGTGTTTIQSGATGSLTGTQNLTGPRIFNNAGSLSKSRGDIQLTANPFFTNSGTLDLTSDVGIISVAASGAIVNNTGTITKSAGGGNSSLTNSTSITFNNTGVVNVNSGTIDIQSNGTNAGIYTISGGKTLSGNFSTPFTGTSITNNGNITLTTLTFNGASAQALNGTGSINDLTINNTNGVNLGGNQTINNALTLTNGTINTGANKIIFIGNPASITRTNGWVNANLQLPFSGAALSKTFYVGDAANYTPVLLSFSSITGSGSVLGSQTPGIHPNLGSSHISSTKRVNRYYSLTPSGFTFGNYDATFNFVPADVSGGATPNDFIVGKYDPNVWTYPTVGTKTATSTQIIGETSFSDFAIGNMLTTYYPRTTATDLSQASQWTTDPAGGAGSSPVNFTSPDQQFNVNDNIANPTVSSTWAISGGSDLILNNTAALTFTPAASLTIGSGSTADFNSKPVTLKSDATGTAFIGQITGILSNASNVTVERYISSANNRAYRLLAPSVNTTTTIRQNWQENGSSAPNYGTHITGSTSGANGFDVTQTGQGSVFTYNPVTPAWEYIDNTNVNTLDAKKGYLVYIRGDRTINLNSVASPLPSNNTTLRATGTLLTGTQTFNGTTGNSGFNLVSNPYASAIDWAGVYNASTGLTQFYTLVDPNIGSRGGYVTVNTAGDKSDANSDATTSIQSGQAFFVQASGVPAPVVNIMETHKSATNNIDVFRLGNQREMFCSSLFYTDGNGNRINADGVTSVYNNNYNAAIDADDAMQIANWDEDIAIARSGRALSIESRPLIDTRDTILFEMARLKTQAYEWQFNASNFTHPNLSASLVDNFTNTKTPIGLNGITVIPFTVTNNSASLAIDRFMVVFGPNIILPVNISSVKAYQKEADIQVEWTMQTETALDKYEVEKSVDGRQFSKMASVMARGVNTATTYHWLDVNAISGSNYYRIKAISKAGDAQYSKVIRVDMGKTINNITVYPNPFDGDAITLSINLPKGKYTVMLVNAPGQQVYRKDLVHPGGAATEILRFGDGLAKGFYHLTVSDGEKIHIQQLLKK